MTKRVEESEFAEQATALLHEVTANGDEVVITRDGKPVAIW
jgi:antitoxin (DNA-binding transcriptional repressor) of toxin-antitoxin stability system